MNLLALDLSIRSTGFVIAVEGERREWGTLKNRQHLSADARRIDIINQLDGVINTSHETHLDLVVIEDLAAHGPGYNGDTAQLHGAVKFWLWSVLEVSDVILVPPKSLKVLGAGNGNATKPEMVAQARERLGYPGFQDDEADAWWLEQWGLHVLQHPGAVKLPQSHTRAFTPATPKKKKKKVTDA